MDFPTPSLDDIRPPVAIEEPKKNGGWDFGDMKPEPQISGPGDGWLDRIADAVPPPSMGFFDGMLDGVDDGDVPPLGITKEELARDPSPRSGGGCVTEPGDVGGGGGGMVNPAIEALEDEAQRAHRENVANDPYGYFRDLY